MKSPANDIASILAAGGLGTVGSTIMVSRVPDSPDAVIVVSSTTSREPQTSTKTENAHDRIDRPNVQVYVRNKPGENSAGYTTAESAKDLLHGKKIFTLNGARYHSIYALSDIAELGVDEKLRPVFSVNFRIERSKT